MTPRESMTEHDCPWRDAIIDAAVVDWTYQNHHEYDPQAAVNALLAWQYVIALEPSVSKDARDFARDVRIATLVEVLPEECHRCAQGLPLFFDHEWKQFSHERPKDIVLCLAQPIVQRLVEMWV